MLIIPSGFDVAIFGKINREKILNVRFINTFAILIRAYRIGFCCARSFENGTITRASRAKIQIANKTYWTSIPENAANLFLRKTAGKSNSIVDQKTDTDVVSMTAFLLVSLL